MKNMKIRTRMLTGFGVIILFMLAIGYCCYGTLEAARARELTDHYLLVAEIVVGVLTAVAVVFSIVLEMGILNDMRRSLNMLRKAADEIAQGSVDVTLTKFRDDEFGELTDDFKKIVENMKYQDEIAEMIAVGDLTADVRVNGETDVLGNALEDIIRENNKMLSDIRESTMQVTVGAEQVSDASQSLAQGSTEQASAIEQVTASMGEIAERTKHNAEQANAANESVHSMKAEASAGDAHMKEMISAMTEINEASENISKIIKVIDDIAFQTNILALNAAVEAARAGVHGKGFAVVAEEVRNLAGKSASAASETAEMIEDSIQKVAHGSRLAEETAASLTKITEGVDQIVDLINGIAVASNDQATAVTQIDQAISQVSQVVQTNSATSEQCAAASEELSNQALALRGLIGNYKLKDVKNQNYEMPETDVYSRPEENEKIISLEGEFGKY